MPYAQQSSNPDKSPSRRRSDAGQIRLQARDVAGLTILADMYAAPYDLLAIRAGTSDTRLRGVVSRWRRAGLVATGRLSEGPHWAWLTPAGMRTVGPKWEAAPPALARLAHIRAALAARMWLEADADWANWRAWWRSERRIRDRRSAAGLGHLPDGEVIWPPVAGSPRPGETWAVEVELTPKAAARTGQIMAGLLAQPYARVCYLAAPAAIPMLTSAAARFPAGQAARVTIRELPSLALMPREAR
jgi:hypothetical protein